MLKEMRVRRQKPGLSFLIIAALIILGFALAWYPFRVSVSPPGKAPPAGEKEPAARKQMIPDAAFPPEPGEDPGRKAPREGREAP